MSAGGLRDPSREAPSSNDGLESRVMVAASRDSSSRGLRRLPILGVEASLAAQRTLTAVERFAVEHEAHPSNAPGETYRALLPLARPRPGEQYAFEVDLDACTGCKACVAACHTLNGLDEGETFRSVGLLTGGSPGAPRIQTVTSSCHHCLEPACLTGCPVGAYEKDPLTGIVRHLDDQCFGCQYCTLMCPYDAPKYNADKGIVRKCDMCSDRLAHGEAPACVQACPNDAIAIRIVEHAAVAAAADARHFVRGAADRDGTLPTTSYKTSRATPDNLLPVDYYRTEVAPAHAPLVVMLTFTQWSAGTYVMGLAGERWLGVHPPPLPFAVAASSLLALGLLASLLHLGRPWLAFRAILGLRTSWLSREVLAFGLLLKLALVQVAIGALPHLPALPGRARLAAWAPALDVATGALAVAAVACSVMVYAATHRAPWSLGRTAARFFGTSALLGAASTLACSVLVDGLAAPEAQSRLLQVLLGLALFKLGLDAWFVREASSRRLSGNTRAARVMLAQLRSITGLRVALLIAGGVLAPTLVLATRATLTLAVAVLVCLVLAAAEAAERYLFFAAAPALRMPGNLR